MSGVRSVRGVVNTFELTTSSSMPSPAIEAAEGIPKGYRAVQSFAPPEWLRGPLFFHPLRLQGDNGNRLGAACYGSHTVGLLHAGTRCGTLRNRAKTLSP